MEVGLTVGGRVAIAVISKLINELIKYAKDQKKMQRGLKDELVRLQKALPKIQAVVDSVDQGLIREENPALAEWLWQLRDATDQADDVMDEIKYYNEKERAEAEKNKVNKVITNFNTIFLRAVHKDPFFKRLMKAVKAIDEVTANVGDFYMLVKDLVKDQKGMVKSAISSRETSSLLNGGTHVFGREKEKEDIINKLLNPFHSKNKLLNPDCKTKGDNLTVLPIIGIGGVGKTTLVQLVYNDPTVEYHFELRMWVCISNNFDVQLLTKKLYESAFDQRPDFDTLDVIQDRLKNKLQSKRFLVVFDDAWYDNDQIEWEKLVAPLKYGKSGSMILLTTRLNAVAKLIGPNVMDSIILKGLNECSMWDLFKEYAFGGEDPDYHKELMKIGRDIVKRLEGSPLAAKTIGATLCSDLNVGHWRSILESELWVSKKGKNDIMPSLRLTYHYLPPHLKSCFSFCSIFPRDHIFSKNDLINMWIALGMVTRSVNGTMRPEDVGSKYFDDMVSKSIFIRSYHMVLKNVFGMRDVFPMNDGIYQLYVMHDLMRDLSILVSQGECLRTSTQMLVHVPNTVRHLYAHIDGSCKLSISGLRNLHTLILDIDEFNHPEQDSIVSEMLKGTKNLRLLLLFAHNLSEFPESASKLLHLRYLRIGSYRIRVFPKSVSKLYLLETMVYHNFGFRHELKEADALGELINLRHLVANFELFDIIAGIGMLTSLQELSLSVGKDMRSALCELSHMKELRRLKIDRIENVGSREVIQHVNLKDNVNLNELSLTWSDPSKPDLNEDALDHLEPHPGLKELTIRNYVGTGRPPIWFTTQALSKLVRLIIDSCNFVHLAYLEELPLLKYMDFKYMYAIERIIHECNLESAFDAFPSLERLSFHYMIAIKEWYLAKQPNKWMQCLRKLDISDCPRLKFLPPIPVRVKELSFRNMGFNVLPKFWNNQNNESGSLSDLVVMSITYCKNLVSLSEGLLQNPERFVVLENLTITCCGEMVNLPPGGFNKFISLKYLYIASCEKIHKLIVQEQCFLPSSLQKLYISSCGQLDTSLPKALESSHSLIDLNLSDCANITNLPTKEVFSRWKTLNRLILDNCLILASLETLLGLSSIKYLEVVRCPQLSPAVPSPLLDRNDVFNHNLQVQPESSSQSSTMETGKTSVQERSLLSVDELVIDDPILLYVEPIRSLSAVRKLVIENCSELLSLPDLPPFLQELYIRNCSPELQTRCGKSGQDWPILCKIPKVILQGSLLSMNDFVERDNGGHLEGKKIVIGM